MKIESLDSASDSKSDNEVTIGDLDHDRGQQHPIIQPSSSIKEIRSQARTLENQRVVTTTHHPPPPSPMLTRSRARELAR